MNYGGKLNKKMLGLLLISSIMLVGCSAANANTQPTLDVDQQSVVQAMPNTAMLNEILQEEKNIQREETANAKKEEKRKAEEARQAEIARVAAEAEKAQKVEEARIAEEKLAQEKALEEDKTWKKTANKQQSKTPVALSEPPPPPSVPAPEVNSNALLIRESGFDWINRMQKKYGVYAYPGTEFTIQSVTGCHKFAPQALGCTSQEVDRDTGKPTHKRITVALTPSSIGNVYVLFHEIGHTQGIMDDCQADIYSRNITGIPGGYYC